VRKIRSKKIVGSFSDRTYTPQDREIVYDRKKKRRSNRTSPKMSRMVKSLRGLQDIDNNNPAKGGFGVG
jgi:hypothetical protein